MENKSLGRYPSWVRFLLMIVALSLLVSSGALAKKKKKDDKLDPHKGNSIVLAGLVHTSDTEAGGARIADGIVGVPGAKVEIVGTGLTTETDNRGFFYFSQGPEGPVSVVISKAGYKTETLSAKVEKSGGALPENLRVELLPEGTQFVDKTPTGQGTLYVAFSPRVVEQSQPQEHWDKNLNTMRAAIAAGADPLTLEGNRGRPHSDPTGKHNNPTNGAESTIMIYPPKSPGRTGFHNTSAAPYWLCFDKPGDTLYVANSARQIQVLDATKGNATISVLPVQQQGFVTDLSLSANGKYIMAAVMAASPGVMMIDTTTKVPAAYLSVDGVGTMTPTAVASSPDGNRVYIVLDGQMGLGGKGLLAVVDAFTGQTLSTVPVGAKPTGIAFSKDHRTAYVVNSSGGNVTVIDLATMQPLGLLSVGVGPQKIVATPDGTKLLVTNRGSGTVSVIDPASNRVVNSISVGTGPMDIKLSPDGSRAYVSNREDGTISVVDVPAMTAIYVTDAMPRSSPMGLAVRP